MSRSLLYGTLAAVAAGLSAVFHGFGARWPTDGDWRAILFAGLGESLAAAILGFALLALVTLLATTAGARLAEPVE